MTIKFKIRQNYITQVSVSQLWHPCLSLLVLSNTTVPFSVLLLPVNRRSSSLLWRNLKSSTHLHSKLSFTCLPWIHVLVWKVFSVRYSLEIQNSLEIQWRKSHCLFLLLCTFTKWMRHPSRQCVISFQCLPSLSLFRNVPYIRLFWSVLVLIPLCWIDTIAQKELRSPRIRKRKQEPGPCHQDLCIFASYAGARHLSTQPMCGWISS